MTAGAKALGTARSVDAEGEVITGWADIVALVYRSSVARAGDGFEVLLRQSELADSVQLLVSGLTVKMKTNLDR